MHVSLIRPPSFFSPSFSRLPLQVTTKVSSLHKKTRNTVTTLSFVLHKTWQLREVIQHIFFVILWHHERQGGGGSSGGFGRKRWKGGGGNKTCHPLCLSAPPPENTLNSGVGIFFVSVWGRQQLWTPALSGRRRRGGAVRDGSRGVSAPHL